MLARINAMRGAEGLGPLIRNPQLDAAARAHSSDMATQQQLTHVSDSSGTPADRVRAAGVNAASVSENVALHQTAAQAHEALVGSEAHRTNMMSPTVTHVGLAALRTERGVYVTQVFASLAPAPSAAPPAPPPPAPPPPAVAPAPPAAPTLPPFSTQTPDVQTSPLPPVAAAPPATPSATYQVQQGTNGTVVIQREGARITAYWVYGNGRWWFYPYPTNAMAGQQLQADVSVQGPPPGFPAHPDGGPTAMAPPIQGRVVSPPPYRQAPMYQPAPPPPGRTYSVQVAPGTAFYAVPPPPLVGQPTRAWRRAYRRWERDRTRWQRQQDALRRRSF